MSALGLRQQLRHRTLLAFRLVYETASVTRAAERLAITQPAVSQLIGALEQGVGFALFSRGPGRRLVPTGAARELYAEACRALDALEAFEAAARVLRHRADSRLAVAAEPALARGFLREAVGRLLRAVPQSDVAIEADYSLEGEDRLLLGDVDLALASAAPASPRLESAVICSPPAVAVLPRAHPLARRRTIALPRLAVERLLLPPPGTPLRAALDAAGGAAGLALRPWGEPADKETLCAKVADGEGIGIVSPLVGRYCAGHALTLRPLDPPVPCPLLMHRRPSSIGPALGERFLAEVAGLCRDLAEDLDRMAGRGDRDAPPHGAAA